MDEEQDPGGASPEAQHAIERRGPLRRWLGERVWPPLRALLVSAVAYGGGQALALPVFILLVERLHWLEIEFRGRTLTTIEPAGAMLAMTVMLCFASLVAVAAWPLLERRPLADLRWRFDASAWRPLALGLAIGAGEVVVVLGLVAVGGGLASVRLGAAGEARLGVAIAWLFVSVLAAPLVEEVINRGWWFENIRRGWGTGVALVVNGLLFGGLHLGNPDANWLGGLNIALVAVSFVLGMLVFRSLWLPIGWHAGWNFTQFFVFGLPNSGFSPSDLGLDGAHLLSTATAGPWWLSGGAFGLEGSVAETIVQLALVIVLGWALARRRTG